MNGFTATLTQRVWTYGLLSALLLWAAFPPLGWWPLAWLAPIGWLGLVHESASMTRRHYWHFLAIGWLHWLAVIHWVRLPHWSTYFGWPLLAFYLALYHLMFLAISRAAVRQWRLPLVIVCPIVWCGLEYLRGRLFTGFALAFLGHSQYRQAWVIQFADVAGATGVSFVMVLFASFVLEGIRRERRWPWLGAAPLVLAFLATYSIARIKQVEGSAIPERTAHIGLVQGSIDTTFSDQDDPVKSFEHYLKLARDLTAKHSDLDLFVWPESMFTSNIPLVTVQTPVAMPEGVELSAEELDQRLRAWRVAFDDKCRWVVQQLGAPVLVGCECIGYGPFEPERANAALWIGADGRLLGRYDKMHPVMFGEYVPLANWFPWIYDIFPIKDGLTPGKGPVIVQAGDLQVSPCICFENTVPHLMRRQVRELIAQGKEPDGLVTITNDGWFWGSSLLDIHLMCGVFRAVELRKPLLIAANTGFSAEIAPTGRLVQQGPRRAPGPFVATISANSADSLYLIWGDWLGVCGAMFIALAALSSAASWRRNRRCGRSDATKRR